MPYRFAIAQSYETFLNKGSFFQNGEMAQWFRALVVFPEELDTIPISHMVAYNHLQVQLQEIQCPPLASMAPGTHVVSICVAPISQELWH